MTVGMFAAILLPVFATTTFASAEDIDPMRLSIGKKGTIQAAVGSITDTSSGTAVTPDQIAARADGKRFVFLGENHATREHQQLEADVVTALQKRGRKVLVGLEMLTRPVQPALDRFIDGTTDEATFLVESDWKKQWGFDYAFYRPLLDAARSQKSTVVALNVPRDWVRSVGKGGLDALTPQQRSQLPSVIEVGAGRHRDVFEALMGGHPPSGADRMLAAQTLWDEGMADTAIKALGSAINDPNVVMVIVAGSGHVMYGQGINLRIARRTGHRGVNVVMGQAPSTASVSAGLADFVYMTRPENKDSK